MRTWQRCLTVIAVILVIRSLGFADMTIRVDYTYDTQSFFDTATKRAALEAAAARFSNILTNTLTAVGTGGTATGTSAGWRIGFDHPGTGASYEISTATSSGSDPLGGFSAANEYGFGGLNANEWILYAGGRNISSAGIGGTGTGLNFESTLDDPNGPMHRGVIPTTSSGPTVQDIPAWGGSIAFDNNGVNWHFDHTTAAPIGTTDFYTIALHEIGHALGLNSSWNQWEDNVNGVNYNGAEAIAAYNADNPGATVTRLRQENGGNPHWDEDRYDSHIFALGSPNLVGTIGLGTPQDLLMEPVADFSPTIRRLELTNTDVAALRDLGGWTTIAVPEPSALLLVGVVVCLFRMKSTVG